MDITEVLSTVKDTATVKRVFAEPYEKDGLTVIPVVLVAFLLTRPRVVRVHAAPAARRARRARR